MSGARTISPTRLARLGWTRTDPRPWTKTRAKWLHRDGWRLEHCGHATSSHPWMLFDPAGRLILTGASGPERRIDFGTCWRDLASAAMWLALHLYAPRRPSSPRPPNRRRRAARPFERTATR